MTISDEAATARFHELLLQHSHEPDMVRRLGIEQEIWRQYGAERLREVLRAQRNSSASELVRGVLDALETFGRNSEPHDDVTMLAARLVP